MKHYLNLLRFGGTEGAENGGTTESAIGSEASGATTDGDISGVEIPTSIPERGKKLYAEAVKETSANFLKAKVEAKADEKSKEIQKPQETQEQPLTYEELIKSDAYREAHKAYMEKTINDRIKKYKGIESENNAIKTLLNTVGLKYGLDTADKDYMQKLSAAIETDDSFYEDYADQNDMTPAEARKIVTLERKLKASEDAQRKAQAEEAQRAQFEMIRQNADKTKIQYPNFDLANELQNQSFVKILSATNGDTTAAYIATHHSDIIKGVAAQVAQKAQEATSNAIASGSMRPNENGINGTASSDVNINFKNMSLAELRAYADAQRKKR